MKWFIPVAALMLSSLGAFATGERVAPAQLQVTSVPDKARLFVDGAPRGFAPQSIYFPEGGVHVVSASLPGYVTADRTVSVENGTVSRVDLTLKRETGLLLITSEPEGAEVRDVKMNSTSLGLTPLLVTSLPTASEHNLELVKSGWLPRRIKVNLKDRTPVVRHEKLMSDSGALVCLSKPEGAEVSVNGVIKGRTPLTLESVPRGSVSIRYLLDGYAMETRELRLNAGDRETVDISMKPLPATLTVVTEPEKATVYVDGEYQGKSPTTVNNLAPGLHTVRAELQDHAPESKILDLANGSSTTTTMRLMSVLGRIEVATIPAGVKVLLDGRTVGETKRSGGGLRSETLSIDKVPQGEHTITFRLRGYREDSQKIKVEAKGVEQVVKTMHKVWTKDVEVETVSGIVSGVLISEGPEEVEVEIKPGVVDRISRGRIKRIERILE